jgi:hypothetical protein
MLNRLGFLAECLALFAGVRDRTRTFLVPIDAENGLHVFVASQLDFYTQRCIATSSLLQADLLWDAEIVFRAAIEAALKVWFVAAAPEPERSVRVREFRERLSEVAIYRFRARASAGHTVKSGPEAMASMLAMSEQEQDVHRAKWTKRERKALEQKWAFAEMVKALENESIGGHRLPYLVNLTHSYGVASHLLHADQMAISLTADRESRAAETREILASLHFAEMSTRQVAILISLSHCAAYTLGKTVQLQEYVDELDRLNQVSKSIREQLHEDQKHLYATDAEPEA